VGVGAQYIRTLSGFEPPNFDSGGSSIYNTSNLTCESGGIGRRTRLRIWRRKAWGFESPLSHQLISILSLLPRFWLRQWYKLALSALNLPPGTSTFATQLWIA
jgi:hypothetical protein